MADLNKLTIAAARDAMRKGDLTSAELTGACLSEIESAGALNAFVHHTPEIAAEQAKAAKLALAKAKLAAKGKGKGKGKKRAANGVAPAGKKVKVAAK